MGYVTKTTATVCAMLAVGGTAQAAPPALETIVQDDALLLHRPPEQVAATVARLEELGVDRVRLTASWSSLAPNADGGAPPPGFDATDPAAYEQGRWATLDTAVRAATGAGLKVLVDAGFWAPRWAADPTDEPRARTNVRADAFAAFAVALARRYSGTFTPPAAPQAAPPPSQDASFLEALLGEREPEPAPTPAPAAGTPLPRVDVLALWNEPNHPAFLSPTWEQRDGGWTPASPHAYRKMVAAAYQAVKAARSDVAILIGNTSSSGGSGGTSPVAPLRFVRELACVDRDLKPVTGGACAGFARVPGDGFAHHPYGLDATPRSSGRGDNVRIGDLRRLRTLLSRLAERGRLARGLKHLWLTEMGYETTGGGAPAGISPARQAHYLVWSEYEASRAGVRSFAQFLLRDVPPATVAQTDSSRRAYGQFASGLERADGTAKPAATAFRAGVHAQRQGRRTLLWVRLRGFSDTQRVVVERSVRGRAWRAVTSFAVPGQGAAARRVRSAARASYRVRVGEIISPPVPAV